MHGPTLPRHLHTRLVLTRIRLDKQSSECCLLQNTRCTGFPGVCVCVSSVYFQDTGVQPLAGLTSVSRCGITAVW